MRKTYAGRMNRHYAAAMLLAHGALTFAEFMEITGWPKGRAAKVLYLLVDQGCVMIRNVHGKRHYELPAR